LVFTHRTINSTWRSTGRETKREEFDSNDPGGKRETTGERQPDPPGLLIAPVPSSIREGAYQEKKRAAYRRGEFEGD